MKEIILDSVNLDLKGNGFDVVKDIILNSDMNIVDTSTENNNIFSAFKSQLVDYLTSTTKRPIQVGNNTVNFYNGILPTLQSSKKYLAFDKIQSNINNYYAGIGGLELAIALTNNLVSTLENKGVLILKNSGLYYEAKKLLHLIKFINLNNNKYVVVKYLLLKKLSPTFFEYLNDEFSDRFGIRSWTFIVPKTRENKKLVSLIEKIPPRKRYSNLILRRIGLNFSSSSNDIYRIQEDSKYFKVTFFRPLEVADIENSKDLVLKEMILTIKYLATKATNVDNEE